MLGIQELGKKFIKAEKHVLYVSMVQMTYQGRNAIICDRSVYGEGGVHCCSLRGNTADEYRCKPKLVLPLGGMVWMGLNEPRISLKYFETIGSPEFHGGAAEHLKATHELLNEQRNRGVKVTPLGKYIVIGPYTNDIMLGKISSFIVFACSEQIRNLSGLAQFNSPGPGSTDPTGNRWQPPELMIMDIPMTLAQQMALN